MEKNYPNLKKKELRKKLDEFLSKGYGGDLVRRAMDQLQKELDEMEKIIQAAMKTGSIESRKIGTLSAKVSVAKRHYNYIKQKLEKD